MMISFSPAPSQRAAFSVIELVVVVGVMLVLAALILPAVTAARASYHQMFCSQKLRALGLGISNYEDTYGSFPIVRQGPPPGHDFSPACALLLYVDEHSIYDKINFSLPTLNSEQPVFSRVASFLCPAQSLDGLKGPGNSYRFNVGVPIGGPLGIGPFYSDQPISVSDVSDGLGRSAFISERVLGSRRQSDFDPSQDVFASPLLVYVNSSVPRSIKACSIWQPTPIQIDRMVGWTWILAKEQTSRYNHVLPPNSLVPDCVIQSVLNGTSVFYGHEPGLISARSWHPGGVNVLFGDGSVRFVINSVDHPVWLAAATIAGGETVPALE